MDTIPVLVIDPATGEGSNADWPALLGEEFTVHVAANPDAAVSRLAAGPRAIVLADAHVHADVLKTIAQRWPNVLRLVMGRYNESNAAMKAVNEVGVFGVLPIPLTVASVHSVFRKAAARYREEMEQRANLEALEDRVSRMQATTIAAAASIDPATNLWDREHLVERLEDECNRLARYQNRFGLLAVQVPEGPIAVAAADLLRDFVRKVDVPALLESHVYAVLCPSTDTAGMIRLPNRLHDAFAAAQLPGSPSGEPVPLSIATVAAGDDKVTSGEVLGRLMEALEQARQTGKTVHWMPPE